MNNKLVIGLVVLVLGCGISFYGGMSYANASRASQFAGGGRFGGAGTGGFAGRGGMGGNRGGFTAGQVLSEDAGSITIKMPDGSTKIVLVASSTQVMKAASGTLSDVAVGSQVVVTGSANTDGSVTAQSIQLRPAGAPTGAPQQQQ